MKELVSHKVQGRFGGKDTSKVFVTDTNIAYEICASNSSSSYRIATIVFHKGTPDNGINGCFNEHLLCILEHRLASFPEDVNQEAVLHIKAALQALQQRTIARIEQGIEGSSTHANR